MSNFVIDPVTDFSECNVCMLGHDEAWKQAVEIARSGDIPAMKMCPEHLKSYLEYESRVEGHD